MNSSVKENVRAERPAVPIAGDQVRAELRLLKRRAGKIQADVLLPRGDFAALDLLPSFHFGCTSAMTLRTIATADGMALSSPYPT
jgi:hypothetical protein